MSLQAKLPFDIHEWEFEFQQRASHPPLMADLWCRALWSNYEKAIDLPVGGLDYVFTGLSKGYVKTSQKQRVLLALRQAVVKRDGYVERLLQDTQKAVENFEDFVERGLNELGSEPSTNLIASFWLEFVRESERLIPWFYIPWYLTEENLLSERVRLGAERHREAVEKITDVQRALAVLCSPTKELALQKEQEAFFELVKYAQGVEDYEREASFQKKAHDYLARFGWMKTFFVLPIECLSLSELVERVKVASQHRALETYELQQTEKRRQQELAKHLIDLFAGDAELVRDIHEAQALAWVLTWSVERSLRAFARLIPVYKEVARVIGVPYEQWVYLTVDEIADGLQGKIISPQVVLQERVKAYVFLMKGGQRRFVFGDRAQTWTNEIEKALHCVEEDIRELRGQSASPGTVMGRVRIARFAKDSYQVQAGEVLVCSMTSPDYVPAMQRAAAIVTDEGGLLSHASIVSRELGRPCVVGAKIATSVLRDGDLVEVRAGEGVVKIVERNLIKKDV